MTPERIANALGDSAIVDHDILRPDGRRAVAAAIERWRQRDRRAHVVVVARGQSLTPLRAIWAARSMDPRRDLLLLLNGARWEARGWGLAPGRVTAILDSAEPALADSYARGLVRALDSLGQASTATTAQSAGGDRGTGAPDDSPPWLWIGAGGAVALVATGWIIRRRMLRSRTRARGFGDRLAEVEQVYADVVLAAEDLHGDDVADLQLRAAELKKRLDAVAGEVRDDPSLAATRLTAGKLRQLENELVTLRSTVLQKRKG